MATLTTTELYSILEEKLGKQQAEAITQMVESKVAQETKSIETKLNTMEQKIDLKIEAVIQTIHLQVERAKNDIQRYMLTLFVTVILMILGLYAAIFLRT
jgi:hypothetical protein